MRVQWLSEEALRRYERLRPATYTGRPQVVAEVRKTRGGAILDPLDLVSDVLDDNDFVSVGRWRGLGRGAVPRRASAVGKCRVLRLRTAFAGQGPVWRLLVCLLRRWLAELRELHTLHRGVLE